MTFEPPLPRDVWDALPESARALIQAMHIQIQSLQAEVANLKARLDANSSNSSRPPSSDPPHVKRQPPRPASKRNRGGQPGHRRSIRPMVPPDRVARTVDCVPAACPCGAALSGVDPAPHPHQVAELPEIRPEVVEYRLHKLTERAGTTPAEILVDGGFAQHDQIDAVSAPGVGCTVYAPVPEPRDPKVDRHMPKPGDSAAVAAWRVRMATPEAKGIYKGRAATAECVNALARGRGLVRFVVRGLARVRAVALWHAVTHNVLRLATLRAAALAGA